MEQQTKKRIEWVILSLLALVAVVSASLFFYQLAYANKIYPHVTVAGIDLGGKNKQQATALLNQKYQSILEDDLTIKTEYGEIKTKVKDTGLSINTKEIIKDSFNVGRDTKFFYSLNKSVRTIWKNNEVRIKPVIDQTKYDNFIKIAVEQLNSKPQDASLKIENGQVVILQEKDGVGVDTNDLINKVMNLAEEKSERTVVLKTIPIVPTVKATDFNTATQYANSILNKNFVFTYEDKTYSPSKSEVGLWITFVNSSGAYQGNLNDSNIMAYLNKIAKNFEITKINKRINALDNSVIEEGREGKYLEKKDAINQLKSKINSNESKIDISLKTYAESPSEIKVFPAEGLIPGRFEGKYIDIDLTLQRLCRVESTAVIDCYSVSSGKPGMPTPQGTFSVTNKTPRQYSSKYGLWMPWWQQFSGDYGIHELPETATWKEVPDHLGTPVSHGCVRLGVGPAQLVYDWTSIGTPVYIHK